MGVAGCVDKPYVRSQGSCAVKGRIDKSETVGLVGFWQVLNAGAEPWERIGKLRK